MLQCSSRFRLIGVPASFAALSLVAVAASFAAEETLFQSHQLTPAEYPKGIEGPAVDAAGNLYVVNFKEKGTIGKVPSGASQSELFAMLPAGSIGNGIRFDRDGRMYVADYKKHNVFVFESGETVPHVYFHSSQFHQPNDLAIATDGTLYASDPSPSQGESGRIWRITRGPNGEGRGEVMSSERDMGEKTNGLDLSPDGGTLYVSESNTREVWAYELQEGKLVAPRLVKKFPEAELDGLRTDVDGKIFVARPGHGTVAVLAPDGTLVREIEVLGDNPSNLTFGGPDGKTVFVTQVDGHFVEDFRVDRPGREPCLQTGQAC
jgi:signal peptidase